MPLICNKYEVIKAINSYSNIRTYLTRIEPIVKEIIPKNKNDYAFIKERLEKIKNVIKIYEILEENGKFYIVMDNNNEIIKKFDILIKTDELLFMKQEEILKAHGNPIYKEELLDLFKRETSMCKISFEKIENYEIKEGKGTGFFCELNDFPIKYALFTNNHILDEYNLRPRNKINIEYYKKSSFIKNKIKIDEKRRVYTNKKLDYTCIEILESDGIKDYFQIDPLLFTDKNFLKNSDIFILQYPRGNELSFSYGKITSLLENKIKHTASTEEGSSGFPIIRRCKEKYIIGLHFGGCKKDGNIEYSFNLATLFDDILYDIKKPSEINCIYITNDNEKEIQLMHDNNEQNIELYINGKKTNFNYKYIKTNQAKEIKVKFIFKKQLTSLSHMFDGCSLLKSVDLSSLNGADITDMSYIFNGCSSLESVDLSSFNASNVINMSYMFYGCSSLKSIDLSSFVSNRATNMSFMFYKCGSLRSIDLSTFNTNKVVDMRFMFSLCSSLNSIDLSTFKTRKDTNIEGMLYDCSSLKETNIIFNKKDKKLLNYITEIRPKEPNIYTITISFVGSERVGKSSIISYICNNSFKVIYPNDPNSPYQVYIELEKGIIIKLNILDTLGQERLYFTMEPLFYYDAEVVILTYDVTIEESLEYLNSRINKLKLNKLLCLVGNKNDVNSNEKKVSTSKGKAFAEKNNMIFYEISAKTGSGVKELFRDIAVKVYELHKSSFHI